MNLLLHGCCADCILKFTHDLKLKNNEVTVFYYNPNIHPRSEYLARKEAMQKICQQLNIKLVVANWSPKDYFSQIKDIAKPARCLSCWQLRLSATAKYAKENQFEAFSTTLLASKYQSLGILKKIGQNLSDQYKVNFFVPGEITLELKTSGFYKQNYCGCCYSLKERLEEKYHQ